MYNATGLSGEMAARIAPPCQDLRAGGTVRRGRSAADETEQGWQEPSATPSDRYIGARGRGFCQRIRDVVNLESLASARSARTPPMRSFLERAPQQAPNRRWRRRRQGREVRGTLSTRASTPLASSRRECRTARQHRAARSRKPRRPSACPLACHAPVPGSCMRQCPG